MTITSGEENEDLNTLNPSIYQTYIIGNETFQDRVYYTSLEDGGEMAIAYYTHNMEWYIQPEQKRIDNIVGGLFKAENDSTCPSDIGFIWQYDDQGNWHEAGKGIVIH